MTTSKTIKALVATAATALLVTGCATGTDIGTPTSTTSTTASSAPPTGGYLQDDRVVPSQSYTSSEDRLDQLMRSVASSEGIYLPEGLGSAYAQDVCDLLDNGNDVYDVVLIALRDLPELGLEAEEHAFLVGASIGGACPEYEYLVG